MQLQGAGKFHPHNVGDSGMEIEPENEISPIVVACEVYLAARIAGNRPC
jgi:hypothetical protein